MNSQWKWGNTTFPFCFWSLKKGKLITTKRQAPCAPFFMAGPTAIPSSWVDLRRFLSLSAGVTSPTFRWYFFLRKRLEVHRGRTRARQISSWQLGENPRWWGFPESWGYANSWMVYSGKSQSKIFHHWGYPRLWKATDHEFPEPQGASRLAVILRYSSPQTHEDEIFFSSEKNMSGFWWRFSPLHWIGLWGLVSPFFLPYNLQWYSHKSYIISVSIHWRMLDSMGSLAPQSRQTHMEVS